MPIVRGTALDERAADVCTRLVAGVALVGRLDGHGPVGMSRVRVLGSTASYLVQSSPVPVLIVPNTKELIDESRLGAV